MGSDNDTSSGFDSKTEASSTASAENRDEFGLAASAGVSLGSGDAMGGTAALDRNGDTDIQPNASKALAAAPMSKNVLIMGGGLLAVGAVVLFLVNRKKR